MTAPTFEEILSNIRGVAGHGAGADQRLITLTEGLKLQVADALAHVELPPAVAAEVDAIFGQVRRSIDDIVVAIFSLEETEDDEDEDDD